ncbi:response regulator transcription factor [Paracoccus sp. (in: a-proteobacteria)]|uniref:response regulator transcription factor n=1 Tax=Paracoccus sp. TaxID=267 RepID=UPI0028A75007|nr:response regulator transcription factor [Paracoccus sp. (in: a-proteobacteria)]
MTAPSAPQILIVDDARDVREPLGLYLRKRGFRTRLAANAAEARKIITEAVIHLAVVDIMMPGESGLNLCHDLTREGGTPVILLTALAEQADRINGLDIGADDYVTKPFDPRELVSRIQAVLRRVPASQPQPSTLRRRFATFVHDPLRELLLTDQGQEIELTSGENRLLGALLDHPGETLSRMHLMDLIRGREARAYDRAVDNLISRLRRKIGDDARETRLIVTEWGGGYRMAATVEELR